MKKRPRQVDVAALANVSPAIVSLVINGRINGNVRISPEAQQRVWDAVRELGYVANPIARKLAGNQNRLLGVFTYEAIFPLEYHNFYYPFLIGIEEEAQVQDYDLLLFTRLDASRKRAIYKDGTNSLQVTDGAILLGVYEEPDEITHLLQEGFPFVYVGKREVPGGDIAYVAADYTSATAQVVEHMYSLGHRRIAYLFDSKGAHREAQRDRRNGYRQALQRLGIPFNERLLAGLNPGDFTPELIQYYLSLGITALLMENTNYVRNLLTMAPMINIQVPQDLSFALVGDSLLETEFIADATGFLIPRREMGQTAVRLLIDLLTGDIPSRTPQIILPCRFVPGKTVVALPSSST